MLVGVLLVATMLLLAVPASRAAGSVVPGDLLAPDDTLSRLITQALAIGGQEIRYRGPRPLPVEPGAYWDRPPAAGQVIVAVDGDGPHLHLVPGSGDVVRLIVQLEGPPLAGAAGGPGLELRAAGLRAAQDRLLHELAERGVAVAVRHRYVRVFNGLAISARAADARPIRRAAGVRAVYPDYALQPLLPQSVPLVGAPAVWAVSDGDGQPVRGSAVRLAVVDTGLDYDHPDLGGPGFPNTRVITGYNFVSDTVDPWDDMGHGTHVAGIAGADGLLRGVAPAASLLAYKVVDAQLGDARTSDTIAAIERALDPDGDPGTADGAQVINLSLGGPGIAGDPLSQACDNAVAGGAVVVVAAGNSGPRYQSLTSPGLAAQAITAGATTKTDGLWSYSSRGPVPGSWAIKPDLVAPGVSISSTLPGAAYEYGTGTSGAAPHVAGAAALLRQLHPAWPPEWVKAALMNTARDLGRSPFEQGAGRLQVDRAAATPVLIVPPSLSLGRVDGAQALWTRQETLTLHNTGAAAVTYTLSIAGSFPAGAGLSVSPTRVTVAPGGWATATLAVTVDTALVPDRATDPFAYWGALRAVPADPSLPGLRVPFAFVKAPLLRLHVDELPASAMFIRDAPLTSRYAWLLTTTTDYLLPSATYSVAVQYQQPYAYVVEGVALSASQTVELSLPRTAAGHQARMVFGDEAGRRAAPNHAVHRFMWGGNGWLVSEVPGSEPLSEITSFSDVPPQFVWERTVVCATAAAGAGQCGETYRQWHGRAEGMSAGVDFPTTPADLARVDHPLRSLPGAAGYTIQELIGYETASYAVLFGPGAATVAVPYARPACYRVPPAGHSLYALRLAMPDPMPGDWQGTFMSPWLHLDAEHYLRWWLPGSAGAFYGRVPAGGVEPLGLGPAHWFARLDINAPDTARLVGAVGRGLFFRAYQGGDVSWELRQPYELRHDGVLVQAGDVGPQTGGSQVLISLPVSGVYSLTLPFTYTLGAAEPMVAHGQVVARFDSRLHATDPNPPFLTGLRLLAASTGQPVDVAAGPVQVEMAIRDGVDGVPAVSLAYDAGAGWVPVAVRRSGEQYAASLPAFADGTAVHLRLVARDAAGNELVHTLAPAYQVRWQPLFLPLLRKGATER